MQWLPLHIILITSFVLFLQEGLYTVHPRCYIKVHYFAAAHLQEYILSLLYMFVIVKKNLKDLKKIMNHWSVKEEPKNPFSSLCLELANFISFLRNRMRLGGKLWLSRMLEFFLYS